MKNSFWKKVLIIGVPIAIQNLINSTVNMIDTFMIGSLGEDYVSAVGLANKVFFVMNLLVFGITSGCSVLMSQYYGSKDEESLNRTFGFSTMLSLAGALIFTLGGLCVPEFLMGLFTKSEALISLGAPYLRIVAISYLFTAFTMSGAAMLRSVNKTRAPMIFTFVSVGINVLCNYILIYGNFGAPELKANGAAIGTVIARVVEFSCTLLYLIFANKGVKLSFKTIVRLNKDIIKKNLRFATPVICNEFGWGLGTTMYSVIYGHMNDSVVAAMTIATSLQDLVYALLFGVSSACAVIVGNQLGAGELEEAQKTAKKLIITGVVMSSLLACILVVLVKPYLMLYETSDTVAGYVFEVCVVFAISMPVKTFNLINIVGILRSGGDTIVCMAIELSCLWGYGVPMGCLGAFGLKLDILYVFIMIMSEEFVKAIIGYLRYRQKKWVKNITVTEN